MVKKIMVAFIMGICIKALYSQPQLVWEREYPFLNPIDMTCDTNGNVFITGGSDGKIYTLKVSSNGDSLWGNKIDVISPYPDYNRGYGIVVSERGVYVIAALCPSQGEYGIYLIRYNPYTGDTIYARYYFLMGSIWFPEMPKDIDLYSNGEKLVVVGTLGDPFLTGSAPTIYEFDAATGNVVNYAWYIGAGDVAISMSVKTNREGNFIVGGQMCEPPPYGLAGFYTWKVEQSFSVIWAKHKWRVLPDPAIYPTLEGCEELTVDHEQNIITTGLLGEDYSNGMFHWWILKYTNDGILVWEKDLGRGEGYSVDVDIYNNLLVAGYSQLSSSGKIWYLSPSGDSIWCIDIPPNLWRLRFHRKNDSLFFYVMRDYGPSVFLYKYFYGLVEIQEKESKNLTILYKIPNILHNSSIFIDKNLYLYDIAGKKLKGMNRNGIYFIKDKEGNKKFKIIKF